MTKANVMIMFSQALFNKMDSENPLIGWSTVQFERYMDFLPNVGEVITMFGSGMKEFEEDFKTNKVKVIERHFFSNDEFYTTVPDLGALLIVIPHDNS